MTKMTRLNLAFVALLVTVACKPALCQYIPTDERGDEDSAIRSEIDANNLHTSVHNFGLTGRTGAGQGTPYEWPTTTNRHYIALSAMFIGGEVRDANGDSIQIVSVPAFRSDPINYTSWSFEPVSSYLNPLADQIAHSSDSTTWPSLWPDKLADSLDPGWSGSWNGLLGKNVIINGDEYYYHYSDDLYARHIFYPDIADSTRRGLGIVVSERVLELTDYILEDALLIVSDIFNVGTNDITKAAVTIWVADFVGGDGDSQDDKPTFDLGENLIYFNDLDGVSSNPAFQGVHVGTPALVFLQTPQNLGLTNIQYNAAGAINFDTTPDSFFWQTFMTPGSFFDPNQIPIPGEFDLFASCGYFPLPAQSSQRLVIGYVFAEDSLNAKRKARYLKAFVGGGYSLDGVNVDLLSPVPGQVATGGSLQIAWDAGSNDPGLAVDILYSSDFGEEWILLGENEINDGSFAWNVDTLLDGVLYKVQVIAHDTSRIGVYAMDSSFTINRSPPAPPQIVIINPVEGERYLEEIDVQWFAGDPEGAPVTVDLSYRIAGWTGWMPLGSDLPNDGLFEWDISELPNSSAYWLKGVVSDGVRQWTDSVGTFRLVSTRYLIPDSAVVSRLTVGTGLIQPHIVDSTDLTGHRYRVEFAVSPDSVTTYDVIDESTGLTIVNDAPEVSGGVEGPLFDGIRLLIQNDELEINDSASSWNRESTHDFVFSLWSFGFDQGTPEYGDYLVRIDTVGVDTSEAFVFHTTTFPSRPVNFTVTNTLTGEQVPFGFIETDGTDGRFTARIDPGFDRSDVIVLLTPVSPDSLGPSWSVRLDPENDTQNPGTGDSLQLVLYKPFRMGDQYVFDAILGPILGVENDLPVSFALSQNYPNPFNPSTEIRFSMGKQEQVRLDIFDILGRKVRTLIDEEHPAGEYRVRWDGTTDGGTRVASGVYLYRIRAKSFNETKKMVLIR